jgi:hypothetical protein
MVELTTLFYTATVKNSIIFIILDIQIYFYHTIPIFVFYFFMLIVIIPLNYGSLYTYISVF